MHSPDVTHSQPNEQWIIEADQAGQRLDRFLVSRLENVSRTQVQQLITDGFVLVNGRSVKPGYMLRAQDKLQVIRTIPAMQPTTVKPQALPLDVIFEDDYLLIVNK